MHPVHTVLEVQVEQVVGQTILQVPADKVNPISHELQTVSEEQAKQLEGQGEQLLGLAR